MIKLSDQNMATNPQCYKDREDYSRRGASLLCGLYAEKRDLFYDESERSKFKSNSCFNLYYSKFITVYCIKSSFK